MKKALLLHPLVFALYPIFTLRAKNAEQLELTDILSTAGIVLILLCIVWFGICQAIKRITNKAVEEKSALVTSMFFLLFFSYGHIVNWLVLAAFQYEKPWLETLLNSGIGIVLLLTIWIGLLAAFIILIFKTRLELQKINNFFAVMAGVMALFILTSTIRSLIYVNGNLEEEFSSTWQARLDAEFPPGQESAAVDDLPDIYYIILDGYGRQDILQEIYQYDNSEFLHFLDQRGFYVAKESHTNYPQTALALSASLNFMYMTEMPIQMAPSMMALWPLRAMMEDNRLFRFLRNHGYLIRTVPTGYLLTETLDSDFVVAPESRMNAFQIEMLDITPIPTFANIVGLQDQSDRFRSRILYGFDHIQSHVGQISPVFTFVHIVSPHPPFVFDAQGNAVESLGLIDTFDGDLYVGNSEDYVKGYREQVVFVSHRIEGVINQIISQSQRPLIIVIQGDHGPGSRLVWSDWQKTYLPERMSILNAYYFYDQEYHRLYPSITPVNSFRVILNQYFGAQYDLLEDRNYFASMGSPYAITDVTEYLTSP